MNIKRFFAKNSREALSMVKRELGEDAVILSNRAVDGGNEILAFREADIESMISEEPSRKPVRHRLEDFDEAVADPTFLSYVNKNHRDYRAEQASSGFLNNDSQAFDDSELPQSAQIKTLPPKVFTQRRSAEKPSIDASMLEPINRPTQKNVVKTNAAKPLVKPQGLVEEKIVEASTVTSNADREANEQQI